MPYDFTTDRQAQTERDHALLAPTVRHAGTLRPDAYGRLKCDVAIVGWGVLKAGEVIEFVGDSARLGSYTTTVFTVEGVEVPALLLCKPYTPPMVVMVRSPYTGQLVPAESGTGRRRVNPW